MCIFLANWKFPLSLFSFSVLAVKEVTQHRETEVLAASLMLLCCATWTLSFQACPWIGMV